MCTKMFSSNFHDFLSSVSSPSYTSEIHKWHFFLIDFFFFQVLFSHAQKKRKYATKEITHWSAFDDWSIDTSCWITSYNCNCPMWSFKPFALVCIRMSSSNSFNPSFRWHIIFKTCIWRGKKWHNYKHMHTCLSQIPLTLRKRTSTYVWYRNSMRLIQTSRCNITSSFEILKLWKIVEGWVIQT